jgi:selenophosphate synthase
MATVKADYPALSTFASSAGCACKIPQFDLAALLKNVPSAADPNLLVGNAESDDAAVYRLPGGQATIRASSAGLPRPMRSRTSMPCAGARCSRSRSWRFR